MLPTIQLYIFLILSPFLSATVHAASTAEQQEQSFSLLSSHFQKFPKQTLRGKVISRAQKNEAGEALLYIDYPSSMSFQYTGAHSFDSNYYSNTYKVKTYPKGRSASPQIQEFSKIDNMLISTFAKLMTSIKEQSITSFLLGQLFEWSIQFKDNQHNLKVGTNNSLSSLKGIELHFNENKELRYIKTEVAGNAAIFEFYVVEANYPKSIDAKMFQ